MLTLIGSLIGFLASVFPEVMQLFKARQDNAQELAMYQLQIQAMQIQGNQKMDELVAQSDITSITAAHAPQQLLGIKWIDGLNGTVRPVIAYAFFLLYAGIKSYQLYHMGSAISDTPWLYWNDEDQIIFASIISFYFGNRTMKKYREAN